MTTSESRLGDGGLCARWTGWYLPALVVIGGAFAYMGTLADGPYWGDGIELAAAAHVLGIPHPTGYPLYALLAKAAQCLPLGTLGFRVNLLDAALGVWTAWLWYWIAWEIFGRLEARRPKGTPSLFGWRLGAPMAAAALALTLVWSRTFWIHAVTTEVYSLGMAVLAAGTWVVLRLTRRFDGRFWAAGWLLLGLALSNHRLALILAPALAVAGGVGLLQRIRAGAGALPSGWIRTLWKRHGRALILGPMLTLVGLTPHLYLPIRARAHPPLNWGDPATLDRFLWTVRGGQFAQTRFLRVESPNRPFNGKNYPVWARRRIQHLTDWTLEQIGWPRGRADRARPSAVIALWLFVLAGLGLWARRDGPAFLAVAAMSALNMAVLFLYNIPDMAGYYQPLFPWTVLTGFIAAIFGLRWIQDRWLQAAWPPILSLLLILPLATVLMNRRDLTYLNSSAPMRYGRLALDHAEPRALILTGGDSDIYALWYQQVVERRRTDVAVLGTNFLAGSPWYRKYFPSDQEWVLDFPFKDAIMTTPEAFEQHGADFLAVLDAQMRSGRAAYATFPPNPAFPFTAHCAPKAEIALLTEEDREVPEADLVNEEIGREVVGFSGIGQVHTVPIFYQIAPEGGILPGEVLYRLTQVRRAGGGQ